MSAASSHRHERVARATRVAGWLALFALGCQQKPPATPSPEPPKEVAKEEPPPLKKCEALSEDCRGDGIVRARVPGTVLVFTPPEGWLYAQLPEATVAQVNEKGAVIAIASFEPDKSVVKRAKQRGEKAGELAKLVGVDTKDMKKLALPPKGSRDIAGLKMQLWELDEGKRKSDLGQLLVWLADVEGKSLLGIGWASVEKEADQILEALRTLEKGDASDGGKGKDGDAKKGGGK
jgi:hypothetical protein